MATPICEHGHPVRDSHGAPLIPDCGCRPRPWPDPTAAHLADPMFQAIWEVIKDWDIHVPTVDGPGLYTTATGNHVRAIVDRLPKLHDHRVSETLDALAHVLTQGFDGCLPPDEVAALLRNLLCPPR